MSPDSHARDVGRALIPYAPDTITTCESRDEQSVAKLAAAMHFKYAFFPSSGRWPDAVALSDHLPQLAKFRD